MKIICVACNYLKHAEEMGAKRNENPVFFLKPDTSILKAPNPFFLPYFSSDIQYELEIVLRINRLGKHIQAKFANRYYDAIGLGIDFTARDLQVECKKNGLPWEIAKAFDASAAISEFVSINEYKDIYNLNFKLYKNEDLVQAANTNEMIFNYDRIIEHVSKFITLKIGDIIFTGTPAGVGKVNIGDNLKAFIEDKEMLNLYIK